MAKEKSVIKLAKDKAKKVTSEKNTVSQSSDENIKCVSAEDARKYPALKDKKGSFIKVGIYKKLTQEKTEEKPVEEKVEKKSKKKSK